VVGCRKHVFDMLTEQFFLGGGGRRLVQPCHASAHATVTECRCFEGRFERSLIKVGRNVFTRYEEKLRTVNL